MCHVDDENVISKVLGRMWASRGLQALVGGLVQGGLALNVPALFPCAEGHCLLRQTWP